jgi:uncharacterized membrane protein
MNRFADALYQIAITLWVGGMWAIGFLVAPTLFAELPDRMLAGILAGAMFKWGAWAGIACASYVLLFLLTTRGGRAFKSAALWLALLMLLLTLAGHFGIQPVLAQIKAEAPRQVLEGVLRDRFAVWHGISSGLYLLQSLLGLALVLVSRRA